MPITIYDKQLSKSITLPSGQLTKMKTLSLTSQFKRHLNVKLSNRNFSSRFKPKVSQHSQDIECDDLFTSCDQSNAREIVNFKQDHRKQQKIQGIVGASKYDGYIRQIIDSLQPHATVESEKTKLHIKKDLIMVFVIGFKEWKKQANEIANSKTDADSSLYKFMYICATKRTSYSTRNKLENFFVSDRYSILTSSEGVKLVFMEKDFYGEIVTAKIFFTYLGSLKLMNKNLCADKADTESAGLISELMLQIEELQAERYIVKTEVDKLREILKDTENEKNKINYCYIKELLNTRQLEFCIEETIHLEECKNTNNEERCITQRNDNENVAENHEENGEHLVTSQNLDMLTTQDQIQDEMVGVPYDALHRFGHAYCFNVRLKDIGPSECSMNRLIHHNYVCSDDHITTYDLQEDNWKGTPGCMRNKYWWNIQAKQIPSSEANTDASSDESLSTVESTRIRLFRNVIRNETYRMMSNIDMVISEAEHLFGLERSRIFFDLLATELCHFGSARAISAFVPNMVESTVRQNVISFFEQSCDMMNILMTLLLRYPDSKRLQQLPEQNFISLMKSVITSSLKTKTKGRKKLSLEGNMYIMVDPKEFERLGEEIPEDVLNRLGCGDEMVVHMFVDTRLERPQPSDRRENGLIQSIYFPSDCRLFIYIPTENGSYWHQLDMRRANRISKCYGR